MEGVRIVEVRSGDGKRRGAGRTDAVWDDGREREKKGGTGMGNAVVEWDEGRREGE